MKYLSILVLLLITLPNHAQNWRAVGNGLDNDVRCFYADTNVLYAGGSFYSSGSNVVNGVSRLINQEWDSLEGGVVMCNVTGCNPVVSLYEFNNELYAGGFFFGMQNTANTQGIAKWDGVAWRSVGGCTGVVFGMTEYNNELYAAGNFDSIGGVQAYCIARYDGTNWWPVADTIFKNQAISSVTVYQNELYVGGTFQYSPLGINCVGRYNGIAWSAVGSGGFTSGGSGINTMEVYQNALFVGGYLTPAMGAPGEGVAQWNGTVWQDVGGGLKDTLGYPANVFDFCVHDNKLIAGGTFRYAGGAYACNIAQWDGNQWCSLGSQFSSGIGALQSFDDTLYVGGGFWSIDGNSAHQYIAQWIGGNFVDTCGNATDIFNYSMSFPVRVFPNPSNTNITLNFSGVPTSRTIIITDNLGREILREQTSDSQHTISVQSFAEGVYFYSIIEDGELKANGKFVVAR